MYSTCIYCRAPLGANETVETFPIGRRLAFDASNGRLWVICVRCMRWNLSPIEERWEAIEQCEQLFRDTRLRVSTDNIGLARLHEGLELVRIGQPQRPEFAAWRYGQQFAARRRKFLVRGGIGVAAVSAIVLGGAAAGMIAGGSLYGLWLALDAFVHGSKESVVAKVPMASGEIVKVRRRHLLETRLTADQDAPEGWKLHLRFKNGSRDIVGDRATHALGLVLPHVNQGGAGREHVRDAVSVLESSGGPEQFFALAARHTRLSPTGKLQHDRTPEERWTGVKSRAGTLGLPREQVLALEMALHEETERRALEGELAMLEAAWKEAEEIASIADDLLVPDRIRQRLRELSGEQG